MNEKVPTQDLTSPVSDLSVTDRQLQLLDRVLREECSYVDREALGHWCGLNRPWWVPNNGLVQENYLRLLKQLHANEVPNIALRLGRRARVEDLGVMGYAMMASPTLEQGLRVAMNLAHQVYPNVTVSLDTDRDHAILGCQIAPAASDYYQLLLEEWMVSLWGYIQALLPEGVAACASYAMLSFSAPTYHWQYQQILGCRVVFDQPRSLLAIPKQWLYIAVEGHSDQAQALFDGQIRRLLREKEHSGDIVSRVKRLLLERAAECQFKLELTAPLMALSARTLRRYLADAGVSFRQVSLEVRMELARDYLLSSRLTAQEVAYQLGYSQPNNFYRAFKNYYGLPPEQYRLSNR